MEGCCSTYDTRRTKSRQLDNLPHFFEAWDIHHVGPMNLQRGLQIDIPDTACSVTGDLGNGFHGTASREDKKAK